MDFLERETSSGTLRGPCRFISIASVDERRPVLVTLNGTRCTFVCWLSRLSVGVISVGRAERPSSISDHASDPDCETFLPASLYGGNSVEASFAEVDGVKMGESGNDSDVGVLLVVGYVGSSDSP